MRAQILGVVVGVIFFAHAVPSWSQDVLVEEDDGVFLPARATSWMEVGDAVIFSLEEDLEPETVAELLRGRLAGAAISVEEGRLKIVGIPLDALLGQLSTVSLSGEGADPLADLALLGEAVADDGPEGGGSIRATNPDAVALASMIEAYDPKELFVAEVVRITRDAFPNVIVRLKARTVPEAGPLSAKLKRGRILEGPVVLAAKDGAVDFHAVRNQSNLAAYFLQRGDYVNVHVRIGDKGRLEWDHVERRSGHACPES